jgi:hypothetical protein
MNIDRRDLDRYITGNYGENFFTRNLPDESHCSVQQVDTWQVRDGEGLIDEGPEEEMRANFDSYTASDNTFDWIAPLLLVHVVMSAW